MRLVQMEAPGDCGPGGLATVPGVELTDATRDFPDRATRGVSDDEMVGYLAPRGVPALASRSGRPAGCRPPRRSRA